MNTFLSSSALVFSALVLSACVATGTGPGAGGNATSAERVCARAVADQTGIANVTVIAHVPYSRGAITNVEVPSRNIRYICHTDTSGSVFELLQV